MKGESTTGSQALGAGGGESHIHPRKSCPAWQCGSLLLSEASLQQHLKELVGWQELGEPHLKLGQVF